MRAYARTSRHTGVSVGPLGFVILSPFLFAWFVLESFFYLAVFAFWALLWLGWAVGQAGWAVHGWWRWREPRFKTPTSQTSPSFQPMPPSMRLESCVVMGDDYFWAGDRCPRDVLGRCKECSSYYTVGHRGTCSWSQMNGGGR